MKKTKISAIYLIENVVSPLYYIGQSSDVTTRWASHRHDITHGTRKANSRLRNSWQKHGEHAFKFAVIEVCSIENLTIREIYWLNKYREMYPGLIANTEGPADNPMRGRKHTSETRSKLSLAGKGKSKSPEHRAKIGNSHRGRKQPQSAGQNSPMHRPEVKAKILVKTHNQIEDLDTGETWRTMSDCALAIGSTQRYVSNCVRRGWRCKGHRLRKSFAPNTSENINSTWTKKHVNMMKGKKHSVESLEKMSRSQTGRRKTPEHCAKIAASNLGKVMSAESRVKMSESKRGRKNPKIAGLLNPSCRPEARAKLRGANNPACRPEVRAKMSAARSNWIEDVDTGQQWRTMSECAADIGVSITLVSKKIAKGCVCAGRTLRRLDRSMWGAIGSPEMSNGASRIV